MIETVRAIVAWLHGRLNAPPDLIPVVIHLADGDTFEERAYRVGHTFQGRTRYVVFISSDERVEGVSGELPGWSALYSVVGDEEDEDVIVTP